MFVSDSVIQAAVADALKKDDTLPVWIANIARRAHARAYNLIVRSLACKGFTLDQITNWDEGESFETDLSVYFTLVNNNILHTIGVDERFAFSFDRSKELSCICAVMIDGVVQTPAGTFGQPAVGAMDSTSIFGEFPDPDDIDSESEPLHW